MPDECNFFLFSFSPSSPLPSPPPSGRTRGTASSRQAEKEKRGREKEGLWRRDKGLSVSVCHLIHRPLLRPAGPSVIRCLTHTHTKIETHTFTHWTTTTTNTHTHQRRAADTQTLTCSPPCFTHSLRWHNKRTHTFSLRSASPTQAHTHFLPTFTAKMTNTQTHTRCGQKATQTFARALRPVSHIQHWWQTHQHTPK